MLEKYHGILRYFGSLWIRVHLNPDVKLNHTLSKKFQYAVQNVENYDIYKSVEKIKLYEQSLLRNESQLL
jgi:hypothetical protein